MAPGRVPHGFYWRGVAQQRSIDTVLQVLEGYEGGGRAGDRVAIGPRLDRLGLPAEVLPRLDLLPPDPEGWPRPVQPHHGMWPTPGWAHLAQNLAGATVVAVALFGLSPANARTAVERISAQQGQTGSFVPIFFVDTAQQSMFRRKGYMVQYFPPGSFGAPEQLASFQERFTLAWHKWGCSALIDLSAPNLLAPLIKGLGFTEARPPRDDADRDWGRPMPRIRPGRTPDIAALRAAHAASGLADEPDNFVLYRIIGNDLYPRHERGQSERNVRFILEHEPRLADCERRWVINRIIDPEDEAAVIALLEAAGEPYLRIGFDWDAYAAADWDLAALPSPQLVVEGALDAMSERLRLRAETALCRPRTIYAMNNNGARNAALDDGRTRAKWVLPWDGNCFVTAEAWDQIRAAVREQPYFKYWQVPMARLTDNALLLDPGFQPAAVDEPQVMFRRDATERFDERFPYGRRPKVEFFWRMGVPGPWDLSRDDVWDLPRPRLSPEAGEVGRAGWVARLSSGMAELESDSKLSQTGREAARNAAIVATLDALNDRAMRRTFDPARLTVYPDPPPGIGTALGATLVEAAERALLRGPGSVIDKQARPPGGDLHDYWHPAPYWWPNPVTLDGLPYVRRDGERVPGTQPFEPGSERYDRTRLQQMFDDTMVLALAAAATGDARYARHATRLLVTWFVDPETRMTPHLRYAQVRPGADDSETSGSGIIEFKDIYFLLDAARLLERSGALAGDDMARFRDWMRTYLDWLQASPQGRAARRARNNHGTCHDLQVAAIAAYLDDTALLRSTLRTSKARLLDQFAADGSQPLELGRTRPLHYALFNLQAWQNLADLAAGCGIDLWAVADADGPILHRATRWLTAEIVAGETTFADLAEIDPARLWPLLSAARAHHADMPDGPAAPPRALYSPFDGIRPFWSLGSDPLDATKD